MNITLTSDSEESLSTKTADLAALLKDRTVHIIHESRFVGYNELGIEQWEVELEVIKMIHEDMEILLPVGFDGRVFIRGDQVWPARKFSAWVGEMKTSAGTDYYVCVGIRGGEYITPHLFKKKGKAEYEVAEWNHLFGIGPEPDILDPKYDE